VQLLYYQILEVTPPGANMENILFSIATNTEGGIDRFVMAAYYIAEAYGR
jgi:hypothetical protein